jgi:hypothetical protein
MHAMPRRRSVMTMMMRGSSYGQIGDVFSDALSSVTDSLGVTDPADNGTAPASYTTSDTEPLPGQPGYAGPLPVPGGFSYPYGNPPPPNAAPVPIGPIATQTGGGGTPGPVSFRPGNWDQTRNPPEYVIASGDTMVGIAALYLGNGARWTEIRDIQVNADGSMGPNGPYLNHLDSVWFPGSTATGTSFRPGAVLLMPAEALAKAQQLIGTPGTPQAPPTPGAPGTKPPGFAPPPLTAAPGTPGAGFFSGMSTGKKVALGLGAGVLAYIGYEVLK